MRHWNQVKPASNPAAVTVPDTAADNACPEAETRNQPLADRRFLLVSLPAGPFGRYFAKHLLMAGADVSRVILNGGDLLNWGVRRTLWPRVPHPLWPAWLNWRITERSITDLVVFGDVISMNAEALAAARRNGVRTWVLENGYNRPDWITLETTGANANSCMPRDPRAYDHVDVSTPLPRGPPVGAITPYHSLNISAYFLAAIFGMPFFPTYRYPYKLGVWPQVFGHIRRYFTALARRGEWDRKALEVMAEDRPFFLVCLQRDGDSQLYEHSNLKTNRAVMASVMANFATQAPADCRLVFKNHPLDHGVEDLRAICLRLACDFQIADRVEFLDGGQFADLARASRGVVSVNSTAAYAALGFGVPVKLLGRAVFDIDGLIDPAPLNAFWREPRAPDHDLFTRFRRELSRRTQVRGSYHNPKHMDGTASRLVGLIRLT